MIKEEDCCDNCEEGIEPCCDEELAQHIEEHIVEQDKPEQQTDIVTEGVTTNIDYLVNCLCCPSKFYVIQNALTGLSKEEIVELRNRLRTYTKTGMLHRMLENYFTAVLV
jgi:hypothetical protein